MDSEDYGCGVEVTGRPPAHFNRDFSHFYRRLHIFLPLDRVCEAIQLSEKRSRTVSHNGDVQETWRVVYCHVLFE